MFISSESIFSKGRRGFGSGQSQSRSEAMCPLLLGLYFFLTSLIIPISFLQFLAIFSATLSPMGRGAVHPSPCGFLLFTQKSMGERVKSIEKWFFFVSIVVLCLYTNFNFVTPSFVSNIFVFSFYMSFITLKYNLKIKKNTN